MENIDLKIKKHSFFQIFLFMYVMYPFSFSYIKILYYGFVLFILFKTCISFFYGNVTKKDISFIFGFITSFCICILLTLICPLIQNTWEFSYFLTFVNYLILYICSIILFDLSDNFYDFIVLFLKANSFYVIFSFILLIPNIRLFYQDFTGITISDSLNNTWQAKSGLYYTRFGLQGFSGFEHTFKCSFAFSLGCWLLTFLKNRKVKATVIFNMIINFIGCCLYGRVGILSSILVLTVYSLFVIIKYKKFKLLFFIVCLFLVISFLFLYFFETLKEFPFVKFAFEPFINIVENKSFETESSNGLKTMWRVPSLKAVAFGDAMYMENGHYYTRTDVGFIRPLLFWGLLGSFNYYWMVIFLVISIVNCQRKNGTILGAIILCLMLFYELKGEIVLVLLQLLIPISMIFYKRKVMQINFSNQIKNYFFKSKVNYEN